MASTNVTSIAPLSRSRYDCFLCNSDTFEGSSNRQSLLAYFVLLYSLWTVGIVFVDNLEKYSGRMLWIFPVGYLIAYLASHGRLLPKLLLEEASHDTVRKQANMFKTQV